MATIGTEHSVEVGWGPGFSVGLVTSLAMFGVSFGQVLSYFHFFPNDSRSLKLRVGTMFLLDCVHTVGLLGTFWHVLLSCRRNTSPDCQIQLHHSWFSMMVFTGMMFISFFARTFYVHRVWIISGKNNLITGVIVLVTLSQTSFELLSASLALTDRGWQVMYNSLYPALAAGANSVSDFLITISIAYFLRSRPQHRKGNYIRQLKVVFVEMGLMSCIVSIFAVVALSLPDIDARLYWGTAPGLLLTKVSFNSMLAVLNTRETIRQRQNEARGQMFDLRTLRSSIFNHAVPLEDT